MKRKLIKTLRQMNHDMSLAELKRAYSHSKSNDLSYHDTLYLNIIEGHPNKYTSSQIADLLNITRPSVTQKINELCKKGHIIRTQSESDKRVYYLAVNPESTWCDCATRDEEEELEARVLERYGEEKMDVLCDMLEYISELIEKHMIEGE